MRVDVKEFNNCYREHQEKSRLGAEKKFKGGLADSTVETARLHTATHLLNGALRKVLGVELVQKGSNITAERLRFDFTLERKMTAEELQKVSYIVNGAIVLDISITCQEMTQEARTTGAIGAFDDKYGEKVRVYTIGDYSKEIFGGPHAQSKGELKNFKIIKEQNSSTKVRK